MMYRSFITKFFIIELCVFGTMCVICRMYRGVFVFKIIFIIANFIYVRVVNHIVAKKTDSYINKNFNEVFVECINQMYPQNGFIKQFQGAFPPFVAAYLVVTHQKIKGLELIEHEVKLFFVFVLLSVLSCLTILFI